MWPIVLGLGAAGALGYAVFGKKKATLPIVGHPGTTLPSPSGGIIHNPSIPLPKYPGAAGTPVVISSSSTMMMPAPKQIATSPAGNPIISTTPTNPDTGKPTITNIVATSGPAVASAHALYDYLVAHGVDHTSAFTSLVHDFQSNAGSDQSSVGLHGPITVNGVYDAPTSAALTIYTGNPVPPDQSAPPLSFGQTVDPNAAAAFSLSSANLYAYLKIHPKPSGLTATARSNADPVLKTFVKAFQHDVNNDPKYAGPAFPDPNLRVIKTKLTEDGIFGPQTANALAAVTFDKQPT